MKPASVRSDILAMTVITAIGLYAILILALPFSEGARRLAARRFHRALPAPAWALLQPMPAMYNFDNRWTVRVVPRTAGPDGNAPDTGACPGGGALGHHVAGVVSLARIGFIRCGVPVRVEYTTTYRGTMVETAYDVAPRMNGRGLTVARVEQR